MTWLGFWQAVLRHSGAALARMGCREPSSSNAAALFASSALQPCPFLLCCSECGGPAWRVGAAVHQPAGLPAGAFPKPDVAMRSCDCSRCEAPGLHVACMRALPAALGLRPPATHTCPPSTLPAEHAGGWRSRHCSLPDRRTAQQRVEERPVCHCSAGGCTGHGPACGMSGRHFHVAMFSVQTCCHSTVDTMLLLEANAPVRRSVATFVWKGNTNASMNVLARTF